MSDWLCVYRLKALSRQGWRLRGLTDVESVAAHSWGVSFLVLNLLPAHLCMEKALSYAVIHDVAEAKTGDITPYDGVSKEEKAQLERSAFEALCDPKLSVMFEAYEKQADEEARFVRQCDRLDMAIQAQLYKKERGLEAQEFFESAKRIITEPSLLAVYETVVSSPL